MRRRLETSPATGRKGRFEVGVERGARATDREFVETTCKTIHRERNVDVDPGWDLPELVKEVPPSEPCVSPPIAAMFASTFGCTRTGSRLYPAPAGGDGCARPPGSRMGPIPRIQRKNKPRGADGTPGRSSGAVTLARNFKQPASRRFGSLIICARWRENAEDSRSPGPHLPLVGVLPGWGIPRRPAEHLANPRFFSSVAWKIADPQIPRVTGERPRASLPTERALPRCPGRPWR